MRDLTPANAVYSLERVDAMLVAACDTLGLPDKPDVDAVDAFVVRAYRQAWEQ